MKMIRTLHAIALGWLLAVLAPPAWPQYPITPIRLIVPTTAGSVPDIVARMFAEQLALALAQPLVVDNRPGGGGVIGLDAVARAAPDGYTLGLLTLPFVITPALIPKMPYDVERDLQPVTLLAWNYSVLVVPQGSGITSVADLVARAKANPGTIKYSSGGIATPSHLTLALLENKSGIRLSHIPYTGGPAAWTALLAGEVDALGTSVAIASANVKAGKVRALATSAPQRIAAMPEVPTFLELGYAGVELRDWQGIVVPAGTPRAIVERLHAALTQVLQSSELRARLASRGQEPAGLGPDEFTTFQASEMRKWHALVRAAGIKGD
jgi:tripartite-type tricarboxylate transporter receptor subunit TctC